MDRKVDNCTKSSFILMKSPHTSRILWPGCRSRCSLKAQDPESKARAYCSSLTSNVRHEMIVKAKSFLARFSWSLSSRLTRRKKRRRYISSRLRGGLRSLSLTSNCESDLLRSLIISSTQRNIPSDFSCSILEMESRSPGSLRRSLFILASIPASIKAPMSPGSATIGVLHYR